MKWNHNIWSNCGRTLGMAMLLAPLSGQPMPALGIEHLFTSSGVPNQPLSRSLYRQNRYQDKCCVRFEALPSVSSVRARTVQLMWC